MREQYHEFETDSPLLNQHKFQKGDRVQTCSNFTGTVLRVGRDEIGVYIVVCLDLIPGEFVYDPCELKIVHQKDWNESWE